MTTGSRAQVMNGNAENTAGGLGEKDLKRVDGRIVPKKKSKLGNSPALKKWRDAVDKARKKLKIKKGEFALIKGKLLDEARKIYSK